MAISVEQLRESLPGVLVEPPGLRWHGEDRTFFHYPPLETDWGEIRLLVQLCDGGRFLQFRSIDLFTLSENMRARQQQIELIVSHNYWKKTVQFGFDPEDGEVCLYVDLPLMDNSTVSRRLMERILATVRISGGDLLRELKLKAEQVPAPAEEMQPGESWWVRVLRKSLRLVFRRYGQF